MMYPFMHAAWQHCSCAPCVTMIASHCCLLHNGNKKPSIPLAHAVGMKETYHFMILILDLIDYEHYEWNI